MKESEIKKRVCSFENLYKALWICKRNVNWKDSIAGYVLKCDLSNYFGSTSHEVAIEAVRKRVKDECFKSWKAHVEQGDSYNLVRKMTEYYKNLWR